MRPVLLLALVALGLASATAQARIVQPDQPPAPTAERGGRAVPAGNRASAAACTWPAGLDIVTALAFDACFGMSRSEMLARFGAANRLAIEAERRPWRAPRLAVKAARERRVESRPHR